MKTKLMLDSGAYSAFRKKTTIDREAYAEYVKTHSDIFKVCVNLDVIGDGKKSFENWKWFYDKGVKLMPVYHVGTDEKFLKKYLEKADYVGLGAIANLSATRRIKGLQKIWDSYLLNKDGTAKVKVHGMGLTAVPILVRFPWYSVDSVSPVLQAGYGGVYFPRLENGELNYLKLDMYKISGMSKAHVTGMVASYFNLPKSILKAYGKLVESYGLTVGTLKEDYSNTIFGALTENPTEATQESLVGGYESRLRWNLIMWMGLNNKINEIHGTPVDLYVGSSGHFKFIVETNKIYGTDLGQLFSYFDTNVQKNIHEIISIAE
jgi:hypothetical protein